MKTLYYYIKRNIIKQSILNIIFLRYRCSKVFIGNRGCGFYICPDLLHESPNTDGEHCGFVSISGGVGDDISFDIELHKRFGFSEIHLFDPTPLTVDWVKNQMLPPEFAFHPFGIGGTSGVVDFYLSGATNASSASSSSTVFGKRFDSEDNKIQVPIKSLREIVDGLGYSYIDILKLDIEGSEFDVIDSLNHISPVKFGQICIEFHQRFFDNRWSVLRKAIRTLSSHGYKCFSVNWNIMEFSFINVRIFENHIKRI